MCHPKRSPNRAIALGVALAFCLSGPVSAQPITRDAEYYQGLFEYAKQEADKAFEQSQWWDKQYEREGASEFGCQSLVHGADELEKAVARAEDMLAAADKLGDDDLYGSVSRYRSSLVELLDAHRDEHMQQCSAD